MPCVRANITLECKESYLCGTRYALHGYSEGCISINGWSEKTISKGRVCKYMYWWNLLLLNKIGSREWEIFLRNWNFGAPVSTWQGVLLIAKTFTLKKRQVSTFVKWDCWHKKIHWLNFYPWSITNRALLLISRITGAISGITDTLIGKISRLIR